MPNLCPAAAHHRARIAGLTSAGVAADDPRYAEARHSLRVAVLADRAGKVAAELAALLAAGGDIA